MNIMSYQSLPAVLKENATKYAQKTAISFKKQGVFLSLISAEFYLVYVGDEWAVTGDTLLKGIFQTPLLDVDLIHGGRFNN